MTQVLRGNIVHAPKMGELSILERGYMVLEDGVIRGIYPVLPEELAQAVRRAQLESLLADRGEGYLCGENGSGLSGGEKQRISIARSLLKHASVLLADEATAALDAQTAHQVTDDILSLTGVTRIVVTHTLEQAALRQYDGILVLKDGRIAETGSFDELMERKGYFYALYTVSQ